MFISFNFIYIIISKFSKRKYLMYQRNDNYYRAQEKNPLQGNKYRADIMKEYVRRFHSAPVYQYQPCLEYQKNQPQIRRSSSFGSWLGFSDPQSSNQYSQISLRKSHSQSQRESTQNSIQSSQNSSLCQRKSDYFRRTQEKRPFYEYKRRTPKNESNILTYIATAFAFIFIISFIIDMKFQMENETLLKEKQIQRCFNDYQQNKCDHPVQVLIDQCNKLAVCASKDPKSEVRMTVILSKTLGTLFSTFFSYIGTLGLILLVVIMLACFFKPNSYEEQHHILKYS